MNDDDLDRLRASVAVMLSQRGDKTPDEELARIVYDELRARARRYLGRERAGHTLQPTALVHEAYIRLAGDKEANWNGRTHFLAAAALAMRRVLVDHAREKGAEKRGGDMHRVTLADNQAMTGGPDVDALALKEALDKLASLNERHARVVELRFFGGLTNEEVAEVLEVSRATVDADWRFAKRWLRMELGSKATSLGET